MQYEHKQIEEKWQQEWRKRGTYKVGEDPAKPKYYVLDMFPYPSGAGLHVGHPLGYIASDIVARYKRHSGYNVLHPMGYDSFGLPAEQYAIQTGQHPAKTTEINIYGCLDDEDNVKPEYLNPDGSVKKEALGSDGKPIKGYRRQLDGMGFSFDWGREVRTSDPAYYKWTQWIFLQLFDSWYDHEQQKARPIVELVERFARQGWDASDPCVLTGDIEEDLDAFGAAEWNAFEERTQQRILQHFRLAYLSEAWVNWCPALGTVLANDEVKDGVSERGGHPVERKRMPQWSMRITAYAQRLLDGLDTLDWSASMKEAQRNWIGRSEGALVRFAVKQNNDLTPGPSPQERGEMHPSPTSLQTDKREAPVDFRYDTANQRIYKDLKQRALRMRKAPTAAEAALWRGLRKAMTGERFRRQHILQDFIVDFVCLSRQLVVEVDGDIHDHQKEYDQYRTQRLEAHGFKVVRFTNKEVLDDKPSVIERIKAELAQRPKLEWVKEDDDQDEPDDLSEEGIPPLSTGEGPGVRSHYLQRPQASAPTIDVFTTRPDTLFGVTFLTLAPEHELVPLLTTDDRRAEVEAYVATAKNRSERDRMADVKTVSGVFTGSYATHPFTGEDIPVWVGDYVLAGYGTGAVMAVPGGDQRDWNFATHFRLPIIAVTEGADISKGADESKEGTICTEGFLKGLPVKEAIPRAIEELVKLGAGERRINFRLRDAAFGRQRYWGEPIPIYYKDGVPLALPESALPLELPAIDKFQPTETGEPPLARAERWAWDEANQQLTGSAIGYPLETTTMPGWAGSSWYFLRYMDPHNAERFASPESIAYWQQIDLYMGGSEHATGHLLYFRFWTKFLHDCGWINFDEPAKKLVNQGMIQGVSSIVYRIGSTNHLASMNIAERFSKTFLKADEDNYGVEVLDALIAKHGLSAVAEERVTKDAKVVYPVKIVPFNVDIALVEEGCLDVERFKEWRPDFKGSTMLLEDEKYICGTLVEKMSKSKYNVVNPDEIIAKYGADTLRLYEMFLGPLEQSKPWDTNGIEGTFRFLRKFWNLFHQGSENGRGGEIGKKVGAANAQGASDAPVASTHWVDLPTVTDEPPSKAELKVLHATLKKVTEDIEKMSFNTSVAQFMIAANELGALKCNKRAVLEPLVIALAPFAPHIAEELWEKLGHADSVTGAEWPQWDAQYLVEDNFSYPISFNGKTRLMLEFPVALSKEEVEAQVLANPEVQAKLEGKAPKKVIVVPKRIVNIVV